jgi:hypothetical protein
MAMSTSGSYDYSQTGAEIIIEALELIGVKGAGDTVSAEDQATCLNTLNGMVKLLHAEGVGLWKNVEATLFPAYEGYSYDMGPSGGHCSTAAYKTEIATAAVLGAGTITVDSDDDITNGDYIGIELDDSSVQWTTVNGVPATNVVTLTAVLTDSSEVDNHVYNYTNKIQRPVEILEVRKNSASDYETPLTVISRDEYMRFSNKASKGSATQVYYDPLLTNGKLYVWPACTNVQEYIKFSCKIPIEDFDSASNDSDFPQEWLLPLAWTLGSLVAPKFGKKLDQVYLAQAAGLFQTAKDFGHEDASIYIRTR